MRSSRWTLYNKWRAFSVNAAARDDDERWRDPRRDPPASCCILAVRACAHAIAGQIMPGDLRAACNTERLWVRQHSGQLGVADEYCGVADYCSRRASATQRIAIGSENEDDLLLARVIDTVSLEESDE